MKFIKLGKGTIKIKGRYVKENEKFEAESKDIPVAFRDMVIRADGSSYNEGEQKETKRGEDEDKPAYIKKKVKNKNTWNVYSKDGKKITDKAVKEEEADELMGALTDED